MRWSGFEDAWKRNVGGQSEFLLQVADIFSTGDHGNGQYKTGFCLILRQSFQASTTVRRWTGNMKTRRVFRHCTCEKASCLAGTPAC